jgi:DeoR/GlpR family transcriptional regulator of sugar metabolism
MLNLDRRRELLQLIRIHGTGNVTDLAGQLGVSPSTVRRDLNDLHAHGLLARVHGGATVTTDFEPAPVVRSGAGAEAKRAIGARAATLVRDDSTILVTGGTTTEAMLPYLADRHGLTVITNGLAVAGYLARFPAIEVVVLGGLLRPGELSLLGHLTVAALRELSPEQVFTGVFGVDAEAGLTGAHVREAATDREFVARARRLIVLADSSKIGRIGPARLADVERIDLLVTDPEAPAGPLADLAARGVPTLIA